MRYYADFHPALTPTRLDKVLSVINGFDELIASKKGKIRTIAFPPEQYEHSSLGQEQFLSHLGSVALYTNHEMGREEVKFQLAGKPLNTY